MAWQHDRARQRIKDRINEAPAFQVQRFHDEYLPSYEDHRVKLEAARDPVTPPLFNLPRGRAVLVGTVQVYVGITNYDEFRMDEGRETEASHERALRFLHLYYSTCDRVVGQGRVQRVDFHGGRMHAVVLSLSGTDVNQEDLAEAFAFVRDFQAVADQANRELANSEFTARFRIGIDVGPCVAINNGTGLEQEPMFLGSAANHAAKLASGDQPGVYLSDRARSIMGLPGPGISEASNAVESGIVERVLAQRDETELAERLSVDRPTSPKELVESWRQDIRSKRVDDPTTPRFTFHHKEPPLSEIKYRDLSPSNSIRMPLVSVFADLSGYTAYVDAAIASGDVADAVRALYVIREEFQSVVEGDFEGRKVRFIGDCIHALLAEGDKTQTDARQSATQGVSCAGGLHSSFNLCQQELQGIAALGLAIGLELGPTPISRIGIRGERSVRLATSVATALSEKMQMDCDAGEVKLGPSALQKLPAPLHDLFDASGLATGLSYDDVCIALSVDPAAQAAPVHTRAHTSPSRNVPRAHATTE